jgi:hypothetical protein
MGYCHSPPTKASFVTGAKLVIDGGFIAQSPSNPRRAGTRAILLLKLEGINTPGWASAW